MMRLCGFSLIGTTSVVVLHKTGWDVMGVEYIMTILSYVIAGLLIDYKDGK